MTQLLAKDQLWQNMLRTEPRHRFPRYCWGAALLWIIETGYPCLLAIIIGLLFLTAGIGTMWVLCVIGGICQ